MKLKASVRVKVDTIKKIWRKGRCKLLDHKWSEEVPSPHGGHMQECLRCESTRWVP